jgi:predicted TIM-barrel fold metal-dependent hydrolase
MDHLKQTNARFGRDAPYCAPPDRELRAPKTLFPALACDTHAHICGPVSRFRYAEKRIYTPPDALVLDYACLLKAIGCGRAVLVQPSVYGIDNTALLAGLEDLRASGIDCRGVAVIDRTITDEELARYDEAGIRGIRFNLVDVADPKTGLPLDDMRALCERIAALDWHAELLIHVDDYPDFDVLFADWPVGIVIGHMGYCRLGQGPDSEGFQAMLRLAGAGRCWIKMTGPYRISPGDLPYPQAGNFAEALVENVPRQLIWGTDWPHVMVTKQMPNDADLCDPFTDWLAGIKTRDEILVTNPARLYRFSR